MDKKVLRVVLLISFIEKLQSGAVDERYFMKNKFGPGITTPNLTRYNSITTSQDILI